MLEDRDVVCVGVAVGVAVGSVSGAGGLSTGDRLKTNQTLYGYTPPVLAAHNCWMLTNTGVELFALVEP
jgi:hypothetical protein